MMNVNHSSRVLSFIQETQRIVCMTHYNPDGDALGSLLGLVGILRRAFLSRPILSVCKDPSPPSFHFLPGVLTLQQSYEPKRGDLLIVLDTAEPKLTDFHNELPRLFSPPLAQEDGIQTIKMDHHPAGVDFAHLNIVDPEAASSCEIVVDLAECLEYDIDAPSATCLLTGIYTDTGSLMHSNTSARVYRTCARLLKAGAQQRTIMEKVFRTSKISTLKLWGRVLEKISLTEEGAAISAVTATDFRSTGADFSELTGAIDYVNSIPGMKFSLILSERNGNVKGSLRTLRDDVDVAAMAKKFSGGGHTKAAGFTLEGKLKSEVRWKVVPANGNKQAK